jgi:NADPH:quinone reductase-like Zn-dependent oxidoreductase
MAARMATAVVVGTHGGTDVLSVVSVPVPQPGPGEILIEVEAAGVAYADVLMRRGVYPETPRTPFTPGYDVVGRVLAVGPSVTTLVPGARVAALTVTGGCSTHAIARADLTVEVGEGLHAAQLTALVLNYVTASQLLHRVAAVPRGATVLVHGAAGGVGTALLELAHLHGVRVIGTASGQRTKAVTARHAIAVDRRLGPIKDEVLRHAPAGVAATFDPIGGPHLARSRALTAPDGVVVSYGISFAVDDGRSRFPALLRQGAALARAKITPGPGVRLYVIAGRRGWVSKHPEHLRDDLRGLVCLLEDGTIAPEVTTLPLSEVASAHERLESGAVPGKLVLITGSTP